MIRTTIIVPVRHCGAWDVEVWFRVRRTYYYIVRTFMKRPRFYAFIRIEHETSGETDWVENVFGIFQITFQCAFWVLFTLFRELALSGIRHFDHEKSPYLKLCGCWSVYTVCELSTGVLHRQWHIYPLYTKIKCQWPSKLGVSNFTMHIFFFCLALNKKKIKNYKLQFP